MLAQNDARCKQEDNPNCVEFKKLEDTILTEVIVDHLIIALNKLKAFSIDTTKDTDRIFNDIYPQMYSQKKELISKYINCQDGRENYRNVGN